MKQITYSQTIRALNNLDSLRTKLYVQQYELMCDGKYDEADELQDKVDDIEYLVSKIEDGHMSFEEWTRVNAYVEEREYLRSLACNEG